MNENRCKGSQKRRHIVLSVPKKSRTNRKIDGGSGTEGGVAGAVQTQVGDAVRCRAPDELHYLLTNSFHFSAAGFVAAWRSRQAANRTIWPLAIANAGFPRRGGEPWVRRHHGDWGWRGAGRDAGTGRWGQCLTLRVVLLTAMM